mmetsp:Transcript_28842/g.40586  ORF Transcript_28842/g.40586 Transcript_28842/m.40586 type:complete len:365 (-) Transcript_28842:328-1422(-)
MLQILERLLVHLGVQDIMYRVHLCFPVLLIHVSLLLHLSGRVTVLLNIHFVGSTLHGEPIHLLPQLEDVALVLSQSSLHPTHAEIQGSQAPGGFRAPELRLLLHRTDFLEGLLLLLANIVLQSGFCVGHISFQVAAHHGHLVEAVAERVLRRVQALLRGCQILVREVNSTIKRVDCLVCVTRDLGLGLLQVGLDSSDIMPDGCQDLVHLAAPGIHVQPKRRDHVADSLDGSIQIIVGFLPGNIVHLRVQLGVHLILEIDDVLGQVFFLLLHLLERVGDILHPRVVVLQCFLNITDVEAHGRDLGCHRGLHTLPAGDDGMCGINTGPHLVKVDIDGIHCSSEVLHVTLTCQYDAADVIDFAFVVA